MSEIRFYDDLSGQGPETFDATITGDGLLSLPPGACETHFPDGRADSLLRGDVLWLVPAPDGALVLTKRTLAGERTVDIGSVWPSHPTGRARATWVLAFNRLEIARVF